MNGHGKFNIDIKYIAFRLGFDKNQILISDITWHNTQQYTHTPYFLKFHEIAVTFDILSLYKNLTRNNNNKPLHNEINEPIVIHEIMINDVSIYIEKTSSKDDMAGGLNLWSALGAADNKQQKSLQGELFVCDV